MYATREGREGSGRREESGRELILKLYNIFFAAAGVGGRV